MNIWQGILEYCCLNTVQIKHIILLIVGRTFADLWKQHRKLTRKKLSNGPIRTNISIFSIKSLKQHPKKNETSRNFRKTRTIQLGINPTSKSAQLTKTLRPCGLHSEIQLSMSWRIWEFRWRWAIKI